MSAALDVAVAFLRGPRCEGCRLTAYKNNGDVWTIGWGHTGPEVVRDLVWTQAQADEALVRDAHGVETSILQGLKTKLADCSVAALISFAHNFGYPRLSGSTLWTFVTTGDMLSAALEFPKWNRSAGAVSRGLLHRRMEEAAMFLSW